MRSRARPRSWLYVPADDLRKMSKALGTEADALIFDLEDGVAPGRKEHARAGLGEFLGELDAGGKQVWVRVDPGSWQADIAAVGGSTIDGVILAKADAASLAEVRALRDRQGASWRLAGLVETAAALLDLRALAEVTGVELLMLGEADLRAELGIAEEHGDAGMSVHRDALVLTSAACGLAPPPAPVSTQFRDLAELERTTRHFLARGFFGRTAIHPAQVPVINAVCTPTPEEVAVARDVIERFTAALEDGRGVTVDGRGRMVDEAVVRSARRVLALTGEE